MNIWILNHYAITPDMSGGTRHYDLGKELTKRGYKVTIFASSFHYSQHKELKLSKKYNFYRQKYCGCLYPPSPPAGGFGGPRPPNT